MVIICISYKYTAHMQNYIFKVHVFVNNIWELFQWTYATDAHVNVAVPASHHKTVSSSNAVAPTGFMESCVNSVSLWDGRGKGGREGVYCFLTNKRQPRSVLLA